MIPFTIGSIIIKYLRKSLTKEVENLYSENCKSLLEEIKEVLHKKIDIPYISVGRQY